MQYLVAVSGGIDSVVLLDMLVKEGAHTLTVAHFDHGIRPDSSADARFVKALAEKYNVPFVMRREELGEHASEAFARDRRYAFLREEASKRHAQIATAHHADDIVETVAINLIRGTGWRGLAVLQSRGITRPLLRRTKQQLREYALEHRLEWVEDSTNAGDKYLRNRVRRMAGGTLSVEQKKAIRELRDKQLVIKYAISRELDELVRTYSMSRYFLTNISTEVSQEILREVILQETQTVLTRPQLERALLAVKTAQPNTNFEAGEGVKLTFGAATFVVKTS